MLRRANLALFLLLIVTPSSVGQTTSSTAWTVSVAAIVRFPPKARGTPIFELLYPAKSDVSMEIGLPDRDIWDITFRPSKPDMTQPSHLLVAMKAFGFKPLSANTGVLEYSNGRAEKALKFNPEVDNPPVIENIVRLERKKEAEPTYEFSVFNPADISVNITSLDLVSNSSLRRNCYHEDLRPLLTFVYPISGNYGRGSLHNNADGESFSYPATASVTQGCSERFLTVKAPFNYSIPAKDRLFMRVQLPAIPDNSLDHFRPNQIHKGILGNNSPPKTGLGHPQQLDTDQWSFWAPWTLELQIDGSLLIR